MGNFNSHAHVERDGLATLSVAKLVNFNSHAYVERDIGHVAIATGEGISTHTLTWSVTLADFLWNADETISTHTLTWSVTVAVSISNNPSIFQLTRSRGA